MKRRLRRVLFENLSLKLISLTLALFLFVFVRAEKHSQIQGAISVSFTPPPGQILAEAPPQTLRISVSGPASRMQRFRFEDVSDLQVDLRGTPDGYFKFREDLLDLPAELKVVSIRPPGFTVRYEPLSVRSIPVKVTIQGQVAQGHRIVASRAAPEAVQIQGPKSAVLALGELDTQPVLVDGATSRIVQKVGLMPLPSQVKALSSTALRVEVEVSPISTEATLSDVPVTIKSSGGRRVALQTDAVKVTVSGPAQILANLRKESLVAEVRVKGGETGAFHRRPIVRGLPEGVKVLKIDPAEIEYTVEAEATPSGPAKSGGR